MEWMHRLAATRFHDFLMEAEQERKLAIARQARAHRSGFNVVRHAIASAMGDVAFWLLDGAAARDAAPLQPRTQSR